MIKILFICLGNICRSPMAEYIFKDYLNKNKIDGFYCESRGLSRYEEGNDIYYLAKRCLDRHHIDYDDHRSTVVSKKDYEDFDYLFCMDEYNLRSLKRMFNDESGKIRLLNREGIEDPWPNGDFEKTYEDIIKGIEDFMEEERWKR